MSDTIASTSAATSAAFAAALADPAVHKQLENNFIEHVAELLDDDRLRVDTTRGRRPIPKGALRAVKPSDKSDDVHRLMSQMRKPDRELLSRMPVGRMLDVMLRQKKWMVFNTPIGRLLTVCVSPAKTLLRGEPVQPLKKSELSKLLEDLPPAEAKVPSTVVLMSTSGFTLEAHELAERGANRTVVLVEPNKAGGWAVYGPVETKSLVDLFDPEAVESKRARVREEIEAATGELSAAGIAVDKISARTLLPLQLVESELKNYAKQHPGLVAKRLDGRVVLFQQGSVPASATSASGGGEMPLLDRIRTLFSRKGETEKKVAFLSERRTALMQQQGRSYDDMANLEKKESDLREQFKTANGEITKRRVTGQLLQLRKDIERRQQLLSVLGQQINIVSTHLHNLELVHQGKTAKLPDSDEVASDAAKAEEMLAGLEADTELAGSVGGIANTGMSAEEQALYDELEGANVKTSAEPAAEEPAVESARAAVSPEPAKRPATSARQAEGEPG
jgi:hypothetical protein